MIAFWAIYLAVGWGTSIAALSIGYLSGSLKVMLQLGEVTPWQITTGFIASVAIWPLVWMIWWKLSNDDDGPWLG